MGRPRKPLAQHHRDGTYRQDVHGDRCEPEVPDHPSPTRRLTGDSLKAWEKLVPPLVESGIAKSTDSELLTCLAEWSAERSYWLKAKNVDRGLRTNMLSCSTKHVLTILSKCGMSPVDRTRVVVENKDDGYDELERFLR